MSRYKYTEEFRRKAIELMKKEGITKACKEMNVSHFAIYRWCKEMEGSATQKEEEAVTIELDASIDEQIHEEQPPSESDAHVSDEDERDSQEGEDMIATAMALLVIENTHLREVIKHLRETISGLTDHSLV